jgi:hypothetical protein
MAVVAEVAARHGRRKRDNLRRIHRRPAEASGPRAVSVSSVENATVVAV